MMTIKPKVSAVLETALYVKDLKAAMRFYEQVIGLEFITQVPDRHAFFRVNEAAVLLLFNPAATQLASKGSSLPVPTHGATGQGHVCFSASSAEIDQWKAIFTSQGIEIEADFLWPNNARSLYIRDPSQNSVEFAEPKLWSKSEP